MHGNKWGNIKRREKKFRQKQRDTCAHRQAEMALEKGAKGMGCQKLLPDGLGKVRFGRLF